MKVIHGLEQVVSNLNSSIQNICECLERNIEKATRSLRDKIHENISLTCHSLRELRRMGHPYARRRPRNPHSPGYLIHLQSGELRKSLYFGFAKEREEIQGWVGLDESRAPYARFLLLGTSKMIPRDVLGGSLMEKREELFEIMKEGLRQALIIRGAR
jgi:hypothetical protein